MPADPAILKRIRGCPFARGGRVLVRFRANGYSRVARRSGVPLARLRLTGEGDNVVLLYPSHRGGWEPPGDFGGARHAARPRPRTPQRQSVLPGTPSDLLLTCGTHPTAQPQTSFPVNFRLKRHLP